MATSSTTLDHDVIREWIEARGGRPVVVGSTHDKEGDGLIRIDFNEPTDRLEEIPWDEFFEIFEKNNLAFLHQDQTAAGEESRFFRFLQREGTDQGDDGHESRTGQGTGSAKVDGKTSKTKSADKKPAKSANDDKPKRAEKQDAKPAKVEKDEEKPKRAAAKADKPKAEKTDKPKKEAKPKADKKVDKPKAAKPKAEKDAGAKKSKADKDKKPKKDK